MKKKSVLTIGFFDGVHIGHKKLIEKVVNEGEKKNLRKILLTFDRPPQKVTGLLTPLKEKLYILNDFSLDDIQVIRFDKKFANTLPEDFFYNILIKRFNVHKIIVGYDFVFGKNRSGNIRMLTSLCKKNNVELSVVEPVKLNNKIVSSSYIRELLLKGKIEKANEMLGKFYSLEGEIIKGRGLGSKIGFPTANLKVDKDKLLPQGIFLGFSLLGDSLYKSVANIGFCPTIYNRKKTLKTEVHIIDFSENIYGESVKFFFLKKICDEKKFKNINDLKNHIERDVEYAKKFFYN
ncbi:MAG: bifunctional riboflavin kinase/FAD synthetase [Endomicrobiia bacterium]